MRISRESWVLFALCVADLVLTVWLLLTGRAVEANPILRFYLEAGGMAAFIGAKLLLSAGPILALEVIRVRRPRFVRGLLRAGIAFYLASYVVGGLHVNG